jgi:hypothetical protein
MAIERWRPSGTLMDRDPFRDIQSEMTAGHSERNGQADLDACCRHVRDVS